MALNVMEFASTFEGAGIATDGVDLFSITFNDGTPNEGALQKFSFAGAQLASFTYPGIVNGTGPGVMVFLAGNFWAIGPGGNPDPSLFQFSPAGALLQSIVVTLPEIVSGQSTQWITTDGTSLYVTTHGIDAGLNLVAFVAKYTSAGALVAHVQIGNVARACTYDGTNIWTANETQGSISKISPALAILATIPIGSDILWIAAAGNFVYAVDVIGLTLSQINKTTNAVNWTKPIPSFPLGVATDSSGQIWVYSFGATGLITIFGPTGAETLAPTALPDVTDSAGYLAFLNAFMWLGADTTGGEKLIRFGLIGGGGEVFGTFVGIFSAENIGGGN